MKSIRVPVRVRYPEVDSMGTAHHTAYLVWFEIGRTELLREAGAAYRELEEGGVLFPVVDLQVRYAAPARYDDVVMVSASLAEVRFVRIAFDYRLELERSDRLLAEGRSTHACVNRSGRPMRLPADLRARLIS